MKIEKSSDPLGISIQCLENGAVFVSNVEQDSLASQVGLQVRKSSHMNLYNNLAIGANVKIEYQPGTRSELGNRVASEVNAETIRLMRGSS